MTWGFSPSSSTILYVIVLLRVIFCVREIDYDVMELAKRLNDDRIIINL